MYSDSLSDTQPIELGGQQASPRAAPGAHRPAERSEASKVSELEQKAGLYMPAAIAQPTSTKQTSLSPPQKQKIHDARKKIHEARAAVNVETFRKGRNAVHAVSAVAQKNGISNGAGDKKHKHDEKKLAVAKKIRKQIHNAKRAVDQVSELAKKAGMKTIPVAKTEAATYAKFAEKERSRELATKAPLHATAEQNVKRSMVALQRLQKEAKDHNMRLKYDKPSMQVLLDEGTSDGAQTTSGNEKAKKVAARAEQEMGAVVKIHQGDIAIAQRRLKERIQKANKERELAERNAVSFLSSASSRWKSQWATKSAVAAKEWTAIREKARALLQSEDAKATKAKQQRTVYWESRFASIRAQMSRVQESQKQWYLQQVAFYDRKMSSRVSTAKSSYEMQLSEVRRLAQEARATSESQSSQLRERFRLLITQARDRERQSMMKFKSLEAKAIKMMKARMKKVRLKEEQDIGQTMDELQTAKLKANTELKTTASLKQILVKETAMSQKFESSYKIKLAKLKNAAQLKAHALKKSVAAKLKKLSKGVSKIKAAESKKIKKSIKKAQKLQGDAKQKQKKWLKTAQMNSQQNCKDAMLSARMKARAAKFAAHRVSREAQSSKVISHNHWRDAVEKTRELKKKRDARAHALAESTKATAIAMAKQMYAPTGKAPCDGKVHLDASTAAVTTIPNVKKLDASTEAFADTMIPYDSEEKVVKKRFKKKSKTKEVANKKTHVWANNHAVQIGKTAEVKAKKICKEQEAWFEEVQRDVQQRLGEGADATQKAKAKIETKTSQQESSKIKSIMKQKAAARALEKTKLQALAAASAQIQKIFELKMQTRKTKLLKKVRHLRSRVQKVTSESKLQLKLGEEKAASRKQEAKKLAKLSEAEVGKEKDTAQAKYKSEKLKIKADTQKSIDRLKAELRRSLTQITKASTQGGSSGTNSAINSASASRQQRHTLIKQAKEQYAASVSQLKTQMETKTSTALSIMKQSLSKSKLKMKQEITKIGAAMQKSRAREKSEEIKIDAIKKKLSTAKEDSKKGFQLQAKEKSDLMVRAAKEKQQQLYKNAREKFNKEIIAHTKKRLPSIHSIKKKLSTNSNA